MPRIRRSDVTRALAGLMVAVAATVSAQSPAPSPSPSPVVSPSPSASPSPAVSMSPDIELTANVHWRELRFDRVGTPKVEFSGNPTNETVWEAERENLPKPVEPGVTYTNGGVRLVISTRFQELARALDLEGSSAPPASPSASPSPGPSASPR